MKIIAEELVLPEEQQKAVDIARDQLDGLGVDISGMPDRTVMTHLAVLKDIADNRGMMIDDALVEYAARFSDLSALAGEAMATSEGTRH